MRSRILRWNRLGLGVGLTFHHWCPYKGKERATEIQRTRSHEARGRNWRAHPHARECQGMPGISCSHQKLGGSHGLDYSSGPSEGTYLPCLYFDVTYLTSGMVREWIFTTIHQICGSLLWPHRKTTQPHLTDKTQRFLFFQDEKIIRWLGMGVFDLEKEYTILWIHAAFPSILYTGEYYIQCLVKSVIFNLELIGDLRVKFWKWINIRIILTNILLMFF